MSTATLSMAASRRGALPRVLAAGALVGVLDLAFAVGVYVLVFQVTTATRVLQSIASGLLGSASYTGGATTAILGFVLHFGIALGWATAYFLVYRRSPGLRRYVSTNGGAIVAGLALGALVWLVMDFVVLTLSAARYVPVTSKYFIIQLIGHAVLVGPAMTLIVRD